MVKKCWSPRNKRLLFDLTTVQPMDGSKRHGGGKYGEIVFQGIVKRVLPVACIYDGNRWMNPEIEKIVMEQHFMMYDIDK